MPQNHTSPLTPADMDYLSVLASKANGHGLLHGYAPFYVALEVGDRQHPDAYLLLCWPGLDEKAAHAACLVFDYIADVAQDAFGASMVQSVAYGDDDAASS